MMCPAESFQKILTTEAVESLKIAWNQIWMTYHREGVLKLWELFWEAISEARGDKSRYFSSIGLDSSATPNEIRKVPRRYLRI